MNLTPEHVHLALNHVPFLGAGFAILPLLAGVISKSRATVVAGLLLAVVSGWVTPLVMASGEAAYERYKRGPVAAVLDAKAKDHLEIHEHRAEAWAKVLYASAVVSTLCLGWVLWRGGFARIAGLMAAVFCLAALLSGVWIAESGGFIRRPDFRSASAATSGGGAQAHGEHHD